MSSSNTDPEHLEYHAELVDRWRQNVIQDQPVDLVSSEVFSEASSLIGSVPMAGSWTASTPKSAYAEMQKTDYAIVLDGYGISVREDVVAMPSFVTTLVEKLSTPLEKDLDREAWEKLHHAHQTQANTQHSMEEGSALLALLSEGGLADVLTEDISHERELVDEDKRVDSVRFIYDIIPVLKSAVKLRWNSVTLPTHRTNPMLRLTTPKPTLTVGFWRSMFPEILDSAALWVKKEFYSLARFQICFPYFIVEVKDPSLSGTFHKNQLITAVASGLHMMTTVTTTLGREQLVVYGAFVEDMKASFYVMWKTSKGRMAMAKFIEFTLDDFESFLNCRRLVCNIYLWAIKTQKPLFAAGLAAYALSNPYPASIDLSDD
ncbi:hypothetical protein F5Y04DRAFT_258135 [Hypomontagnella monticulosa]|nr:hypothetical protein F5Y04DRAFT_258135 [Hypomontagnella monticulosa]